MKLHLPKALRGALLACFASVAGFSTTLATGALTGGAFYLAISSSAAAESGEQTGIAPLSESAVQWQDDADDESNWNEATNWSGAVVPDGVDVLLGSEAASKDITLDADVNVGQLNVEGAYTLNVASGASVNFAATGVTLAEGASLTKAGAGTLSATYGIVSTTPFEVEEGVLKVTDVLPGDAESNDAAGQITYEADFSALTVGDAGTLSITAADKANNKRTTVKLGEAFTGTLEITGGYVDTDSQFGAATIKVNGGGLLSRVPAGEISNKIIIGDADATFYSLGSTGIDGTWKTRFTGAFEGSSNSAITIQERGDWYFAGDMSKFAGDVVLNNYYDRVFFETSATVKSFSATGRLDGNATVYFGDGSNSTRFTVKNAMQVTADTTFEIKKNAAFQNDNQVTISANKTFAVKGSGQYDMVGWLNIGSGAKLDLKDSITLNLADTTQTISTGEIAIAAGAVVNDNRNLTIDGNVVISGTGTYNQKGTLTVNEGKTFSLAGVVSIADLTNNGTLNLDHVTLLKLEQWELGTPVVLGTVANAETLNWKALMGYDYQNYSITYADGVLNSAFTDIMWNSTADGDVAWASAENWSIGEVVGTNAMVTLDVIDRTADNPVSDVIQITSDTTIGKIVVKDAYSFLVAAGESWSLAGEVELDTGGSISKSGAGSLSLTSNLITNELNVMEGSLTVEQLSLASGNAFTKRGAGSLTISSLLTADEVNVASGSLTVAEIALKDGTAFTKSGAGDLTLSNASALLGKNMTISGGQMNITQTGVVSSSNNFTITVNAGARVEDSRYWSLTGNTVEVNGGGVYELDGFCLSASGGNATTLNIGADTALHITGTVQDSNGNQGSFMLSNWPAGNVINVHGLLVSDAGISNRDGTGVINVENGGALQLNKGMSRTTHSDKKTTINVKTGGALVVNSTASETAGTQHITTNLSDGATVFTTTGATILNNMVYNGTVKLGAALDTELALTAPTPNVGTLTILGAADKVEAMGTTGTVGEVAAGGTVKYANAVTGTAITLNGGAKFEAAGGLTLSGALTLAADSSAKLAGVVSLGSLSNTGLLDVTQMTDLRIANASGGAMGEIINLGAVTYTAGNTFGYGHDWTATWQDNGTAIITADAAMAWADTGAEGDTDINWSTADNWSGAAAPSTTANVQLAAREGVTRTIALTANTTVGSLRVYDAYNLSVAQGSSYSFTATNGYTFTGDTASLSKTGEGTLSMSLAQAQAAKMHITEGALKLTDEFGYTLTTGVTQSGGINYDLTGITSAATGSLQVDLNGTWNATGMDATAVKLDANFHGTLSVIEGQLLVKYGDAATDGKSDFGGASAIELNTAALYFNANSEVNVTQLIIGNGGAYFTNRSASSVINSALSGTGNLTIHGDKGDDKGITLTGVINLDGKLTVKSTTLTINSATKALFDGGISQTGGNININSAADISELSVTGGTFKINGANVGISSLKSGALTLTGAADLTATLAADAQVTLTGANTADATLSVADGGSASLLGALTLDALTLNGGTLSLNGAVSLGSLSNAGTLNIAGITSLAIADMALTNGSTYNVGTLAGYQNVDWHALLGVDSQFNVAYNASTGYLSIALDSEHLPLWMGGEGATWDSTDANGTDTQSWAIGGTPTSITETSDVVLGNAATLGDASGEVSRTIVLDADARVNTITVQDAYALSVAANHSYSFGAATFVLESGGSLSKVGEGTLRMSAAEATAAKLHIGEGALQLTEANFADASKQDFSAITAGEDGMLIVNGSAQGYQSSSFQGVTFTLSDDFKGTLKLTSGQLNVKNAAGDASYLGGAQALILNKASLAITNGGELIVPKLIIEDTAEGNDAAFLVQGDGTISSDISGNGTIARHGSNVALTLTGAIDLKGTFRNQVGTLNINSESTAYFGGLYNKGTLNLYSSVETGSLTFDNGSTINVTLADGVTLTSRGTGQYGTTGGAINITLGENALLSDAATRRLGNGSLNISGKGVYELSALQLTNGADGDTCVTIGEGSTLHITGTSNTNAGDGGSLLTGTKNFNNTIIVNGTLVLECGISRYSYDTTANTIDVKSTGKIAFNRGLTASVSGDNEIVNIKGGGVLEVSGTATTGTNLVTVVVERNATILGGNAHGATESLIANDMVIAQGFYVGAAAGTTLTLKPESGNFTSTSNSPWINVLGTADNQGGKVVLDVEHLELNGFNVQSGAEAVITGDATLYLNSNGNLAVADDATLTFDGAGVLTLGQAIDNSGLVQFTDAGAMQFVLSEALLTEDIIGVSKTWTLVDGGTVSGWNKDNLSLEQFMLNGSSLSLGEWDSWSLENGKLTLTMLSRFWDATTAGAVWNTTDANWRPASESEETALFEANSRVTFTDRDDQGVAVSKAVTVAENGVQARSVLIAGSGYKFTGGAVQITETLYAQQDATFNNVVVIGRSDEALEIKVDEGMNLSVATLESLSAIKNGVSVYLPEGGSFRKTGTGTLTITDAVSGFINEVAVENGNLVLESDVALTVGTNVITGGTLSNVLLQNHGMVTDYTSGARVTAGNVITSCDGTNDAVLTDVNLQVGSATAYGSLQNVSFAGSSTLSGYITFEKTKHQREMAVADGGSLNVSGLTLDLHGLSGGEKVLIENAATTEGLTGTITGWENITLKYSGVNVNMGSVDVTTAGIVNIKTDGADLYWDGMGAEGGADANWNATSTNWNTQAGVDGSGVYLALSDTYFAATPQGAAKDINVAQDMVAANIYISQGGYSFRGYRVATLGNVEMTTTDTGAITFNNELVVQGTLTANVAGALNFGRETTVVRDTNLTAGSLEVSNHLSVVDGDLNINSGSITPGGEGSFTLTEGADISANNITITVNAGASSDSGFADAKMQSAGSISTTGTLTLAGNAAKTMTGAVEARDIVVNTGVSTNKVSFAQVTAETLTVAAGSTVNLTADGTAGISQIQLSGTLGFEKFAGNFWNYDVESTSEDASVNIASIGKVSMKSLSGADLGNDTYGSIVFNGGFRRLTIDNLHHVLNITFGASEDGVHLTNGTGQIYGDLTLAAGASLTVNCDNVMANGNGAWNLSGTMKLGNTTQTLAGNDINMSAAVISGNMYHQETQQAENGDAVTVDVLNNGILLTEDTQLMFTGDNTISANMNVAAGKTLTLRAGKLPEDNLTISGHLVGSGAVLLAGTSGTGSLTLSADNDYSGTMTVKSGMTVNLAHSGALSNATLHLDAGAVLMTDAGALGAPAQIGSLNLVGSEVVSREGTEYNAGLIQVNNLMATEGFSAIDAAFMVGELSVSDALTLNLQLAFTEGGLQNMMTYNIFTADAGYSLAALAEQLNLELYVVDNGISNHVASNQYKVMYDKEQNVISLRTMLGHIWSGGELDTNGNGLASDGIWSVDNTDGNWSGKNYDESSGYSNAIFVDLPLADGDSWNIPTVTIEGTVAPGDIYFEANTTYYELTAAAGNGLAAGTNIHKAGEADVFLNLADNGTLDKAVGTLDIQAGMLTLYSDLAVSGDITIGGEAHVRAFDGVLVREHYTAKGDFINLTMNDDVISGASAENKGTIKSHYYPNWAVDIKAAEGESVMLQNVTLATTTGQTGDALTNVTIGENVDVTGNYTLNGHITFEHTLANTGTVTLDAATKVEIGKLGYTYQVVGDDETSDQYHVSKGGSYYVYQLIQGGTINGMDTLGVEDVYINGVNISTGLADGVATVFTSSDGSLTLSIGNATYAEDGSLVSVDGTVGMPTWDERWGNATGQPGISRRYAGTADAKLTFAEGKDGATQYYWYSSVVNTDNANKVNGATEEVVVTLSSAATGSVAAGGGTTNGDAAMEMWMYDRSGFNMVIAGRYQEVSAPTDAFTQEGDTHLLVNTHSQWQDAQKEWVVGGSWNVDQNADSYVTVQNGNILTLVGGTYGANQGGDTHVFVDGGTISEIFTGGYHGNVVNSNLTITGGTLGLWTDTVRKRVYGGSYSGTVSGNVNVVVDGNATITELVGGGYHGAVTGDITLDLISGTITRVDAAGVASSTVGGNVQVNLHKDFTLTEIYGGKQASSGATVTGNSTLSFINAGETYDMTGTTVQGFSHFELADDVYVKLTTDNNAFGTDGQSGQLTISGAGKVELGGSAKLMRDVTLSDGATLWLNSNSLGDFNDKSSRPTIIAQDGATIDVTGRPEPGDKAGPGMCLWIDLSGHGVNGIGALYKGEGVTDPSGKVAMPRVTFSDSASVNAEGKIYWIENANGVMQVKLNGNTLTKIGDQSLVIYNADVVDNSANDTDAAVDGTFFVKEGTLGIGYGMRAAKTNVVLSEGTTLDIIAQGSNDAIVGALSGSGSVVLDNTFTITTSTAGSYGKGSDWMTQGADKYSQFSADAGFAYGVFSGSISGAQGLSLAGDGTQYFSGSDSTFSGGVKIQGATTLYLMGSTEGSASMGSSSATAGAVGTGTIAWDSANAKLYLGNGVQVYNNGTTNVDGSNMIIGVEAAPKGDSLTHYLGTNSKGADGGLVYITLDGVDYVEVDTHNLQSISCDGKYADGSFYMAGSLIDRDKMLLVEKSVWEAGSATVAGFSEGGYNTATYSGVLSGNANLMKVGLGTLILDQTNTYTGSTIIDAGSLVLKGWAKIGGSATSAALDVEQKAGSTLMLAYDGSYGNEITGIANDMYISGTGDVRWTTETATGNATAALISAISSKEKFTLSGNISGDGNLLHTASGTLVLSGDSTYTGGTHATMGVLEVQSATGMGAGKVVMEKAADLHVTVEDGTTASRLTTTVKAADSRIDGDVIINGTDATERVLNMSTDGYNATSTQLNDTGVLLVNGSDVQAKSGMLSGTGKLVVSDATGAGASAQMGGLMDYSGDFVVEGSNASISVAQGNFNGGSISVSGQGAKVSMDAGYVHVANGEKLALSSDGSASTDSAAMVKATSVTIDSGATLTVDSKATQYQYNLEKLAADASLAPNPGSLVTFGAGQNIHLGAAEDAYTYHFDADRAMNAQRAGVVDATQGLTLKGGSRYEAERANISLAGGSLTLDTTGGKITLNLLTEGNVVTYNDGMTSQMVLFTDVTSVNLGDTVWGMNEAALAMAAEDGLAAQSANTIYSTLASQYFTGWNITDQTYLVYDVGAGVVYLDKAIPEPTTTTLSLLALAALVARRRRK